MTWARRMAPPTNWIRGSPWPTRGLGDAYNFRATRFGFLQSWIDSSMEASRKAVALAPELPEAHKALALAQAATGAYRESLEENRRAVELSPNHSPAVHNLAVDLLALGRLDEALPWSRRAVELQCAPA